MNKERFFGIITVVLILGIGLLITIHAPVYAQVIGLPVTQEISAINITPLMTSTLDAYAFRDFLSQYSAFTRTTTNPFSTYASGSFAYDDIFSHAAGQQMFYANIFGEALETGQGFYWSPFYTTGGRYLGYVSPVGQVSYDQAFAMSPMSGAFHVGGSMTTPWTHIGTNIDTTYGMGIVPTAMGLAPATSYAAGITHEAFGIPTVFEMAGMNPAAAGTLALITYGTQTAAMDRLLSNTYFFTEQGMPYVPVASYYNPDSYGESHYFFPAGSSAS